MAKSLHIDRSPDIVTGHLESVEGLGLEKDAASVLEKGAASDLEKDAASDLEKDAASAGVPAAIPHK